MEDETIDLAALDELYETEEFQEALQVSMTSTVMRTLQWADERGGVLTEFFEFDQDVYFNT